MPIGSRVLMAAVKYSGTAGLRTINQPELGSAAWHHPLSTTMCIEFGRHEWYVQVDPPTPIAREVKNITYDSSPQGLARL